MPGPSPSTAAEQLRAVDGLTGQIRRVAAGSARTLTETEALARRAAETAAGRPTWSAPSASWARWPPTSSGSRGTSWWRPDVTAAAGRARRTWRSAATSATAPVTWRRPARRSARFPAPGVVAASAVEETAPLGGMAQPPTSTRWCCSRPGSRPRALLEACQAIERAEGRVREERWGARTLDVDIVRFGGRRVAEPDLIIPHPELPNRDFWQRELAELQAHER